MKLIESVIDSNGPCRLFSLTSLISHLQINEAIPAAQFNLHLFLIIHNYLFLTLLSLFAVDAHALLVYAEMFLAVFGHLHPEVLTLQNTKELVRTFLSSMLTLREGRDWKLSSIS